MRLGLLTAMLLAGAGGGIPEAPRPDPEPDPEPPDEGTRVPGGVIRRNPDGSVLVYKTAAIGTEWAAKAMEERAEKARALSNTAPELRRMSLGTTAGDDEGTRRALGWEERAAELRGALRRMDEIDSAGVSPAPEPALPGADAGEGSGAPVAVVDAELQGQIVALHRARAVALDRGDVALARELQARGAALVRQASAPGSRLQVWARKLRAELTPREIAAEVKRERRAQRRKGGK